ncbi:MAG: SMI1/KNR4 family protein [Lachnospiraceae bacterium]|nr:SMI1/KNR4 family protein [Lachnospiraceae bacterium]
MISKELKEIITALEGKGKMLFQEGVSEDQIAEFEEMNGFHFPSQFKEWLLFSDGGECFVPAGVQFYGIAHKPAINVDNDDRPNDHYVVIGALSDGDPVLCEKDKDQISVYNLEAGRIEEDEIYKDFFTFLREMKDLLDIEE